MEVKPCTARRSTHGRGHRRSTPGAPLTEVRPRGTLPGMGSVRRSPPTRSSAATRAARPVEGVPDSGKRVRDPDLDPGPLSNEPQMETHAHMMEIVLLVDSVHWLWRGRTDYFASGNLSIYYPAVSPRTGRPVRKKLAFRGPDFFVVLGAKPKPIRNSWVVENEDGKYPDVIVEVLSKKTRANDRGKKKEIYEKIFRTPEYFLFDPVAVKLEGYRLVRGRYVPIQPGTPTGGSRASAWGSRSGYTRGSGSGSRIEP